MWNCQIENVFISDYLDPFLEQKTDADGRANYSSLDMQAFRSVLKLTPSHPSNPNYS